MNAPEIKNGLLEFNDHGLRYYSGSQLLHDSPGYAAIEPKSLRFGQEARGQAKLHPTKTNHQFWQQLSLEPLPSANKNIRHRADLAYQHIQSLLPEHFTDAPHILAVPGNFSKDQLSLLLGIVQSIKLPVRAVIDSALLACQHIHTPGTYVHVDVQLHQTLISEIIVGAEIECRNVEILGATGMVNFSELWAQGITDQFIHQTRFNPLHRAESEQTLHNQLFDWLHQCSKPGSDGSLRIQLDAREITLLAAPVLAKSDPLYQRIIQRIQQRFGKPDALIISDRLAQLPCSQQTLGQDFTLQVLPAHQLADNLQQGLRHLPETAPQTFIKKVTPIIKSSTSSASNSRVSALAKAVVPPTHLLAGYKAYSLNEPLSINKQGNIAKLPHEEDRLLTIEKRDEQVVVIPIGTTEILINDNPIQSTQPLKAGDKLTLTQQPATAFSFIAEQKN